MTESNKFGLWGLVAIVFGSVIGGSIFNIAQNLARHAALGAVIAAWLITAVGVFFLVMTFKSLADMRPDLTAGIYQYAQVGFGRYVGFNMAWGYWLSVVLGNVTYAVMLNDALGAFFPVLMQHGWVTVIFASVLVWLMYFIVAHGAHSAAYINNILSVVKFGCIVLIIAILVIYARIGMFSYDFWGHATTPSLGGIGSQFSSCMLVTIWSFIGIEGAVMMSSRAKRHKDVGRATIIGFLLALALYLLVSVLCFGVMTQPRMATLPNPSLAYVLDACAGPWTKWLVIISVIISLAGCFTAWTLVCAHIPYEAASVKILPRQFLRVNAKGVPYYGMLVATIFMTLCIISVVTAENVYIAALNLTAMMVLPPYMFCGMYLWKLSYAAPHNIPHGYNRIYIRIISLGAMIFCGYIMWAGSLKLLMVTSLFYLAGTGFFILTRLQQTGKHTLKQWRRIFTPAEMCIFAALCVFAILSLYLLMTGNIVLDS